MTPNSETQSPVKHVSFGLIEKVREEPVGFRVIGDDYRGHHVIPNYVLGRKRFETWWENGKKMGRWTWEYL